MRITATITIIIALSMSAGCQRFNTPSIPIDGLTESKTATTSLLLMPSHTLSLINTETPTIISNIPDAPTETRFNIPTLTLSPTTTLIFTPSPKPSEIPNWTPLPTLNMGQAEKKIAELMKTNGGCQLPCWWGITPGQTSWIEAEQFLSSFSFVGDGVSRQVERDGLTITESIYAPIYYNGYDELSYGINYVVEDSKISIIYVLPKATQNYTLHKLLKIYGEPSQVYVWAFTNPPGSYLPLLLAVYYSDQRMLALYDMEARKTNGYLQACPNQIAPSLSLWAIGDQWDYAKIKRAALGEDPNDELEKLEDVTELDIDSFYQLFQDPNACIETPQELWP